MGKLIQPFSPLSPSTPGFWPAGALVGALVHQRARRGTWLQALPPGYNLALLGAAIFGCGGVGDMLWHTFFGIERMSRRYSAPRTHAGLWRWLMVGGHSTPPGNA